MLKVCSSGPVAVVLFLATAPQVIPSCIARALRQALRSSGLRTPDTVLFCATIPRNQARPNQSDVLLGSLPQDPRHATD